MATEDVAQTVSRLGQSEVEATVDSIRMMVKVGALFVGIGYVLLLFSLSQEFVTLGTIFTEDSMKMWLKLGGIGHILIGIFVVLAGIIKALSLMPDRLSQELTKIQE